MERPGRKNLRRENIHGEKECREEMSARGKEGGSLHVSFGGRESGDRLNKKGARVSQKVGAIDEAWKKKRKKK